MAYPSLQPYAPTPHLPVPTSTTLLDRELPLSPTAALRELHESLSELSAILRSLDLLEKSFIRDSIPAGIYTPICARLLRQYNAVLSDPRVSAEFGDVKSFARKWRLEVPAAVRRIGVGAPATDHHVEVEPKEEEGAGEELVGEGGNGGGSGGVNPKFAAEATQNFITFMDALRLNYRGVEELHPLLAPVVASVDKALEGTGREWEGRGMAVRWLIRLNQGKAGEEIGEEEERELLWDMERGYGSFLEVL